MLIFFFFFYIIKLGKINKFVKKNNNNNKERKKESNQERRFSLFLKDLIYELFVGLLSGIFSGALFYVFFLGRVLFKINENEILRFFNKFLRVLVKKKLRKEQKDIQLYIIYLCS